MGSRQKTERQNQKRKVQERCNGQATKKRLSWYGHVMRRDEKSVAKEGTTMTVQEEGPTEVDGQTAKRYERTPARSKARRMGNLPKPDTRDYYAICDNLCNYFHGHLGLSIYCCMLTTPASSRRSISSTCLKLIVGSITIQYIKQFHCNPLIFT